MVAELPCEPHVRLIQSEGVHTGYTHRESADMVSGFGVRHVRTAKISGHGPDMLCPETKCSLMSLTNFSHFRTDTSTP